MIKANNLSYVGESGRNTSLFRMTKYLIVLVCIAMAMFSCDDTNEPNKPVPTDAYIGTQRQITLGAEMKGFTWQRLSSKCKVTKAFTIGKLTEHQDCELIPARKELDVPISVVFVWYSEEYILIKEI